MSAKNLSLLVSSVDATLLQHNERVELPGVNSLQDLHSQLRQAISSLATQAITCEIWDEDFSDWCQLHSVESMPEKSKLRISRATSLRRKLSKRDRSLSAREALPSPGNNKRSSSTDPFTPQPVVVNGLTFQAGMPQRTTGLVQKHQKAKPRRWTHEEDKLLMDAIAKDGPRNWKGIAASIPGRNHTQCLQRYAKVLKPGLIKGHWTDIEDDQLRQLVSSGWSNWGQIAEKINGRTSKQCRERWFHHLDPQIKRGDYSAEEDNAILQMHHRLGNKWSKIASSLPGRTEDAVKIRYKTLDRHRRQGKQVGVGSSRSSSSSHGSHHHMSGMAQHSHQHQPLPHSHSGMYAQEHGQEQGHLSPPSYASSIGQSQVHANHQQHGAEAEACATTSAVAAALGNISPGQIVIGGEIEASGVLGATSAVAKALDSLSPGQIVMANVVAHHGQPTHQSTYQSTHQPTHQRAPPAAPTSAATTPSAAPSAAPSVAPASTAGACATNKAAAAATGGAGAAQNNNVNFASMEWLENCLRSLETMDVVQSNQSENQGNTALHFGSGRSDFNSINDRDGFDRLVLSLVRDGRAYVQIKQHLQHRFGRILSESEKRRITYVTKTADQVGISMSSFQPQGQGQQQMQVQVGDTAFRLSGVGLSGIDLDLFDSKNSELDGERHSFSMLAISNALDSTSTP